MNKRKPTEELEHDHRIIERVVAAMAILAERLQSGKEVEAGILNDLGEFLRVFAEDCHHGKEERYLFPLLEKKGVPVSGCPLAVLLNEHDRGRRLMADLKQTSEAYFRSGNTDEEALIGTLHRLIELYPAHIWKEDYLLFPMTGKILSDTDQEALAREFEQHESEIGSDVHHGFEQLAESLVTRIRTEEGNATVSPAA
ncbi:MAG: hemerythrin domain-containing protein [Terriglobales bacterium]|jgi:hemerythrin-like domain-containing protein